MRRLVKRAASTMWRGIGRAFEGDVRAPILCYHSVNPVPDENGDPLTPALFAQHLDYLAQNTHVLPLETLVAALKVGDVLPKNAVAITFDDGYRDNYDYVFPLLNRYALHATIFVVTEFVEGAVKLIPSPHWDAMTWDQIREMEASGVVAFGAHTRTHRILSHLDCGEADREIAGSKADLEAALGHPVTLFAYPNGQGADFTAGNVEAVQRCGFDAAVSTFWRTTQNPAAPYLLNRVMIYGNDSVDDLRRKLAGGDDYLYFVHRGIARLKGGVVP